ncbi:cytochrome c oxidase subunit 4 [Leucobacter sp. CSA1]|uniref:Cytochrome c oxidase polypeptide 4 n=1 Tax=Leucobacter chromiisoli TaxID=2796471 RepID=A0A934UU42_9MICO|nr:cytochrome c oxidase subunit 4 [Leucobacter chromiisoli]MBK0419089.1 cytochrome c oxidase subunit 4 [Leucobacter chromiisoli]
MKSNIVIFWILAAYFFLLAAVYTGWNLIEHQYLEWVGSTAILLSGALAAFIAFYLGLVRKKAGGVFVEDREDADIDDGDPELGEFSPWSWWPIFLAFAASVVVLGLCIGFNFWLSFISVPLVLVGVVGWVYEYYRGNFAR